MATRRAPKTANLRKQAMAKNPQSKTQTQPENETEALAQNPTSPEQAQQETLQPQDAANAALTTERDAAQASATQPENPDADPRQAILACSADGVEFWRGGVLFNHEWQRIVNEPRLRIKAADEYGA